MLLFAVGRPVAVLSALFLASLLAPPAAAQSDSTPAREAPSASVAVMPVGLYTAQANLQEATDSVKAVIATEVLTGMLQQLLGAQLISGGRVAAASASPEARATLGAAPCNVIVACARAVGRALGAPWVVMAKVSKTSNLIWLFTGQLIHVASGDLVLDDSTELKGDPEQMIRIGTRIFAERVARTVKAGGVTTNFPAPR